MSKGIEREIQEAVVALLLADADVMACKPEVCNTFDETKAREIVQCVVECDQLASENYGQAGGGDYYTARLAVLTLASLDEDTEGRTMNSAADAVRRMMHAAGFRAAVNARLTLSQIKGILPQEPEPLYEGAIVGRAHVVTVHLEEV